MEKVTNFLEKNVEWVALGLGGLFLLWMVWAYVLTSPVKVQIGGREFNLGDVDRHIRDTSARELAQRIDDPTGVDITFEPLDKRLITIMTNADESAPDLSDAHFSFVMPPVNLEGLPDPDEDRPDQAFVQALPQLPAPQFINKMADGQPTGEQAITRGRSMVAIPVVEQPLLVADGQRQPVRPIDPRQFNPNNPDQNIQQVDRLWVSAMATIPGAPIGAAFQKSQVFQIAPNTNTTFLRVQVQREERLRDGTWGNQTIVPPLAINPLPPLPANEDRDDAFAYADWAAQNTVTLLKPPFYPVLKGSSWRKPAEPEPVLPTAEELRREDYMRDQAERQAEQERRQQERRNQPRTPPGSRRNRDTNNAPRDLDRPASSLDGTVRFHQSRDSAYYEEYTPEIENDPARYPSRQGQPGGPITAEIPPLVTQKFQPDNMPDVEIWFHDDSVESGKTYRYRVRYMMLNPIYGLFNVSRPEELTEQFALTSEWSEWSQPVDLDSLVQYFVNGWRPGANSVNFEVFKWEHGIWQSEVFQNLEPGDMIGGTRQKNNQQVDFTTGVTVVDIREDARRETFVLLVDAQGNLLTRSFRQDQGSGEYRDLRDKVRQDAATAQPAASAR